MNLREAFLASKLLGDEGREGSGSGGDVGMLFMPYDRMAKITQYLPEGDVDDMLAKLQAHPTGWDETITITYFSSYWPGDPDYDGATADDYEETLVLHFGNIDNTANPPTFDVTLNLYGVHYKVSCGFEEDMNTGELRFVIFSQATEPLYDADVVTLTSSV